MASWIGAASVAGTGTSRAIPVTNPTAAGDTILVLLGFNTASMSASAVTDTKGNVYTMDASFVTASPYTYGFRSPGATGGPGGAPTVALTAADTLTVTTGAVSGTMVGSVASHPAGALDVVSAIAVVSGALTGSVAATPTVNGDMVIAANINQPAASALGVVAPFTMLDSRQPAAGAGLWTSFSTDQLAGGAGAGVAQTQTINWTGSSSWRGIAWAFKPGITPITGTGAVAAKKAKPAGAGTYTAPVTGTGAVAAKKAALAGAGAYTAPVTGTGAIAAKKAKLAGAGTYTAPPAPITGTGAIAAKKITLAGAGSYSAVAAITGTGAVAAKKIALAGFGVYPYVPPGAAQLAAAPPAPLSPAVVWAGVNLHEGDRDDGLFVMVTNVEGWYGTPPLAGNDLARVLTDGAVYGNKVTAARVIAISGAADGPRPVLLAYARQLAALAVADDPAYLSITEDDDSPSPPMLTAEARADSDSLVLAWLNWQAFTYQFTVTAADPRIYEAAQRTATLNPAGAGGTGRTYPWAPPRLYATADIPNAAQLDNPGTVAAPVTATYSGPLAASQLTDGFTSINLQALVAGEVVYVNTETLAATAPGGASRASYVLAGSQPLVVPPGGVVWHLYSTGAGDVTLNWAGAYE